MHISQTARALTAAIHLGGTSLLWAGQAFPPCPGGRYEVDGAALVSAIPGTPDGVIIETAGPSEAVPPLAMVASGCPQTAAKWKGSRTGTRLSVRFPSCGGLPGTARLRAKIDPTCGTMTGVFSGRAFPRRTFTASLPGRREGRLTGTVSAAQGDGGVLLPGATVFLRDHTTGVRVPGGATTDVHGDFTLTQQGAGTFDVCAEAFGLVTSCDAEPVELSPTTKKPYRELVLRPDGGAIHGRVTLADGTPCYYDRPGLDIHVTAHVTLGNRTVTGNSKGEYVLAGIPDAGTYPIGIDCDAFHENLNVALGAPQLSGAQPVDFSLRNRPPAITLLAASDATGWLRSATPGQTVHVTAEAADPDGDPVQYFWRDGNDLVTPIDAATIAWPLLGVPAANTITLEVTDGKGGFDSRQLVLGTSQTGDRFIGTVKDGATGSPLAGAQVDVDGIAATTDEAGAFRVAAPQGERHVMTVRHPGYALVSQVHHGPAMGLALRLVPAKRTTVDPTQDIDIADGRKGATVHIAANSLVDNLGQPPSGAVTIDLSTYDPLSGGVPGDREGIDANQQAVTVRHTQAMSLDIADASGRRFNLAPGRPALVTFQAPATVSPPESLPLSHFDEASGTWHEMGHAIRRGARYLAVVPSFSAWDVGKHASDTACLRVAVDDGMLERPFHIRVVLTPGVVQGPWEQVGEFTVTDQTSLVYGLPPNSFGQIQISPMSDTDEILYVFPFITNAGGLKSPPPYPYNGCTPVTLKAVLPGSTWLTRMGFGSPQEAEDYYASIGARPDKDTFKKWKDANGFVTGDSESDVSFFNPNEIGLGRRANCKRTDVYPYDVACYVTKFGHVGGSPDEMLDDTIDHQNPGDTVAMEFSPGPNTNGTRITKFYVYGPDGDLKTHTAFDPEGDVKHVPNVCLHCHGNTRKGNGNWNGDVNGKFVTLDPTEYRYPASGAHTLVNQQERFREMNAMIAYTFHHDGPGWDLMDSIYPQGVHNVGSTAIHAPVPVGWVGHETLYDKVVKPNCRTCHMYVDNYSSGFSFKAFDGQMMHFGRQRVCEGQMPNAISPMLRLWRTSNPNLMDVFSNELGLAGCNSWDEQPTVHIDAPANGSAVGYGGLGVTHFSATVSDPDDAVATLAVKWTSDEGPMGYGHAVDWVFANPGTHTVTVKVTDPHGASATHSITVHADETLPTMTIVKPAVGQALYRNVAYPFLGTSYDPNEPYLAVDCKLMLWISDKPGDAPGSGCQPQMTFTTLGTRTVTLYGMDSDNGVGSTSRVVTVIDPPANSPPIAVINAPGDGDSLDNHLPVVLAGSATDPDGQVTPTVSWTMQVGGGVETTIGNTLSVGWIPKNYLPQSCTPVDVILRLYATDPDGTRSDSITVSVYYPPC